MWVTVEDKEKNEIIKCTDGYTIKIFMQMYTETHWKSLCNLKPGRHFFFKKRDASVGQSVGLLGHHLGSE